MTSRRVAILVAIGVLGGCNTPPPPPVQPYAKKFTCHIDHGDGHPIYYYKQYWGYDPEASDEYRWITESHGPLSWVGPDSMNMDHCTQTLYFTPGRMYRFVTVSAIQPVMGPGPDGEPQYWHGDVVTVTDPEVADGDASDVDLGYIQL